jgi:hypothetical protein
MIHDFTRPSGKGKIAQQITELQDAIRKITPKGSSSVHVDVTSDGTNFTATEKGRDEGDNINVVCRWL